MRRTLKLILVSLSFLALVVLFLLTIFWFRNRAFLGNPEEEFMGYLDQNQFDFNSQKLVKGDKLPFFNSDFYQNDIVLLGEIHGYADVQEIDEALFIHLNKTKGTRTYLIELDEAGAAQLNKYLSTSPKDNALLESAVLKLREVVPQQAGKQWIQKWSNLYDYNLSLPTSAKIKVVGLDWAEHQKGQGLSRDEIMVENFKQAIQNEGLVGESFYGFFGLMHVLQEKLPNSDYSYLAARLKKEGYTLSSIVCLDVESEVYLPANDIMPITPKDGKTKLMSMNGPIILLKGVLDFMAITQPHSITLFNLNRSYSPYRVKGIEKLHVRINFIGSHVQMVSKEHCPTDFTQYIVFMRGAKPITPLNE